MEKGESSECCTINSLSFVSSCSHFFLSPFKQIVHESQYQSLRRSTIELQRAFRARRKNEAAAQIQSLCRRCLARKSYHAARNLIELYKIQINAAIVIQRAWNASQERFIQRCLMILERVKAAMVIQRWWEKVQLSRRQQEILLSDANKRKSTASSISSSTFSDLRPQLPKMPPCDPVSLLCTFDFGLLSAGIMSRSITNLVMPWGNLVAMDGDQTNNNHGQMEGESLLRKFRSAVRIQRFWREERSRRTKERYYQSIAAAWIQCIWRGFQARKQLDQLWREEQAAALIQMAWYRFQERCLETEMSATVRLQSQWRMVVCQTKYADIRLTSSAGATCIQAAWRMHDQRAEFLHCRTAALTIQRAARAAAERKRTQNPWWFSRWSPSSLPRVSNE